jgi:hypothetical protein
VSETEAYIMPDDDAPPPPKVKAIEPYKEDGDGAETMLISEDKHARADARMAMRAIRLNWGVTPEMREIIKRRAMKTIEKETVLIGVDKDGNPITSEHAADNNATRASELVLKMDSMDQADAHLADKNERLDDGKNTENQSIKVIYTNRIHAEVNQ